MKLVTYFSDETKIDLDARETGITVRKQGTYDEAPKPLFKLVERNGKLALLVLPNWDMEILVETEVKRTKVTEIA